LLLLPLRWWLLLSLGLEEGRLLLVGQPGHD
jgi:hypothetical protein